MCRNVRLYDNCYWWWEDYDINFNQNPKIFIEENPVEYVVCKLSGLVLCNQHLWTEMPFSGMTRLSKFNKEVVASADSVIWHSVGSNVAFHWLLCCQSIKSHFAYCYIITMVTERHTNLLSQVQGSRFDLNLNVFWKFGWMLSTKIRYQFALRKQSFYNKASDWPALVIIANQNPC